MRGWARGKYREWIGERSLASKVLGHVYHLITPPKAFRSVTNPGDLGGEKAHQEQDRRIVPGFGAPRLGTGSDFLVVLRSGGLMARHLGRLGDRRAAPNVAGYGTHAPLRTKIVATSSS